MQKWIREWLSRAESQLHAAGVEAARLNAHELLAHLLGFSRGIDLFLASAGELEEVAQASIQQKFELLLKRRGAGEPLQHLLGEVEFFAHRFRVDKRALIPRPETEVLVELCLAQLEKLDANKGEGRKLERLLVDVGTGTGILALSLGAALPWARVLGLDISGDALELARENLLFLETQGAEDLRKRVSFHESDLLGAVSVEREITLVVANLPYIARAELASLSPEVGFDPVLALDGGEDGLDLVRGLCAQLAERAGKVELVALEVGYDQGESTAELLSEAGFEQVWIEKDLQGVARFVLGRGGGR